MLTVPPAILDILRLHIGAVVGLAVCDGRLVIDPIVKPRYTLDELLAQCDLDKPVRWDEEEREWLDLLPTGREL